MSKHVVINALSKMGFPYNAFVVYNAMLVVARMWLDLPELALDLKQPTPLPVRQKTQTIQKMHETHYTISAEFRHFVKVIDLHVLKFNGPFFSSHLPDLLAALTASLKGALSLTFSYIILTPGFPFFNSGILAGAFSSIQHLNSGIFLNTQFQDTHWISTIIQ